MPIIADLAVLVPSRGRPDNLARLITEVHRTARGRTHVLAGVDQDDPQLKDYIGLRKTLLAPGDEIHTSEQNDGTSSSGRTISRISARASTAITRSLGDDMVPRTPGWDVKLMDAIEEDFGGTGIAYPYDAIRDDIPEAYLLSADIPAALGWVMQPSLNHWYNDNVIADLGHGAGCIRQLRGVIVDHLNVGTGKALVDQTAIDQGSKIAADEAAYKAWFRSGRARDVDTVRGLRARQAVPALV